MAWSIIAVFSLLQSSYNSLAWLHRASSQSQAAKWLVYLLDQGRINGTFFEFCENTVSGDRLFGLVLLPLDSYDYCCWALRGVWSGDSLPLAECQNILASQSAVNHLLAMRQEWGWWGGGGDRQCGKESQCYKGKQHEKKSFWIWIQV